MIQITNLTKVYHTGSEDVTALAGINMQIADGELIAFAGESGSGKTTLLNLIGTLDSITGGDILFDGIHLATMAEREKTAFRRLNLGFIFQSYNLIPVLTALENVELAFRALSRKELKEFGIKDTRKESMRILRDVGLEEYALRRPGEMSGGQQQRVSIARALVRRPSLVLADEPTANLDSRNSNMILELLTLLNEKYGMTVIYSSHDQIVLEHVERIVILRDGQIVEDSRCC